MLIDLKTTLDKYNIKPKWVIHVGAHWAEEHDYYIDIGIERFFYIEPCEEAFKIMCSKLGNAIDEKEIGRLHGIKGIMASIKGIDVACVACGSEDVEMPMYVSRNNQGQSNSLLKPSLHLNQHPEVIFNDAEVVRVCKLDNITSQKYDMLAMDVQGYEGEVLKGATKTLESVNIVYTEVNRGFTYENNALIEEMDELLSDFKRVETFWPSPNWTWGDAIYIRKTLLNE